MRAERTRRRLKGGHVLPGRGSHARRLLLSGWQLCAAPFAPQAGPADSPAQGWVEIDRPAPAAAALRSVGLWSLEGPPRRFDAEDWWYRLRFDAPEVAAQGRSVLGFDGLATTAQAWLNGQPLLEGSNMFVAHACEVTGRLREQGNELLLHFAALDGLLAQRRPRPRWRTPMVAHQQLRWFRTTLLGRTPGWSPPAAVVGPWRDVWLEQRTGAEVTEVHLRPGVCGAAGTVRAEVAFDTPQAAAVESVLLTLERQGRQWTQALARAAGAACRFEGELRIDGAALWWPHTHGEPALYDAGLAVGLRDGSRFTHDAGRVGFRTVEHDTAGGRFSLKVNGVAVFCRGACWTPLDPVSLRSSPQACEQAVAQVRGAGMNMLRVAGNMVYEEPHFYRACDEAGVLVWQDLMFANMDYPADDEAFMASVRQEVGQQLRRLRGHPCLAVLCGNSEVEQQAAMWGAPRELWQPGLFDGPLAQLSAALAPGVPYWPSSTHGGAFPHQADAGTASYYGVGAYLRPAEDARLSALSFATECLAFANVPETAALGRLPGGLATRAHHAGWKERSPRDLGAGWDFDDVRDHYLAQVFQVEPHRLRHTDHERYLALGRVATGEAMARAFAQWRRPGSGCGGALVWFLRDLWAGAGWGLLDDAGQPKACFHFLRRSLQPVTVLLLDEGVNGLVAHVLNESAHDWQGELELEAWRDGEVRIAQARLAVAVPPRGVQTVAVAGLLPHFMDLGHAYRFGPAACDAVALTLRGAGGEAVAQAFHFTEALAARREADLGLEATVRHVGPGTVALRLRTRRLAQAVHVEVPGYSADDDYFHLAPGHDKQVILRGTGPVGGSVQALNWSGSAVLGLEASDPQAGEPPSPRNEPHPALESST